MKKLFIFGAMALSLSIFISSCEKDEVRKEKPSDSIDNEKGDSFEKKGANPNENARGFYELNLPKEITDLEFGRYDELIDFDLYFSEDDLSEEDFIFEKEVISLDKDGNQVNGTIQVKHNPLRGKIERISVCETLRGEAGFNRGILVKAAKNPNIDLNLDDLIDQAQPGARCEIACQEAYSNNTTGCGGDEDCLKKAWRMYKRCSRTCTIDAFGRAIRDWAVTICILC